MISLSWSVGAGSPEGAATLVAQVRQSGGSLDSLAVLTVIFLFVGAVVMMYSTVWTRRLLRSLEGHSSRVTWRVLLGLMVFFVAGYLAAMALVWTGYMTALIPLTGVVFFGGAVFVLIVVHTSHRNISRLLEVRGFLDDVLDSMGEALLVIDEDGAIEKVNHAAMELFDRRRDAILGQPLDELLASEEWSFGDVDGPVERSGEAAAVRSDGETVPVLFSATSLASGAHDGLGVVCIVRDITSRKQHELELERQNNRLDEFASVVSHDLRNPLSIAKGRLDLVDTSTDEQHLEHVEDALDRIESLAEGLLTLARQGQTVGETAAVSLESLVNLAWVTVDTADATLRTDGELGTVSADGDRLRQALENLFTNAVDHGGDGVIVSVGRLSTVDGFYVADDGPGIPPDEREQVFAHGYSTASDGTGFGLAIVRTILEAHGWRVSVTESRQGGAQFEVRTASTRSNGAQERGVDGVVTHSNT